MTPPKVAMEHGAGCKPLSGSNRDSGLGLGGGSGFRVVWS